MDEDVWPYLLGAGWGTTLAVTEEKAKKVKKNPVGFHSVKVKKNGRRTPQGNH